MTKSKEIEDTIRKDIARGHYQPGDKLPSMRETAEKYTINKLTAKRIYDRLKQDGLIENLVGKGSFVTFPHSYWISGKSNDFTGAYLHESFIKPYMDTLFNNEILKKDRADWFGKEDSRGLLSLRLLLAKRYNLSPEGIMIITGAQQGLSLTEMALPCQLSENVLFEDPTYSGALTLFRPNHFVSYTEEGPCLDEMQNINWDRIKAFYTISGLHNPTGRTTAHHIREQIVDLAEKHNFYIIEDDYLSDFSTNSSPRYVDLAPQRCIYIKSLSKVTSPGLRLGCLWVPPSLYGSYLHHKLFSDMGSGGLEQHIIRYFLEEGLFDDYLISLKKIILERKEKLLTILGEYDWLSVLNPETRGYFLWVKSKRDLPPSPVPWSGGERFSMNPRYKKYLRLAFMSQDDKAFSQALSNLDYRLTQTQHQ